MNKWKRLLIKAVVLIALVVTACLVLANCNQEPDVNQPPTTEALATEPTQTEPVTEPPEPIVATWMVEEDYILDCREYFVYDVTAGEFLETSSTPDETKLYPASITKLFTAYVALQHLSPETEVTVGAEITMIDPDSTVAQLQQGDKVTVKQLVGGMMLPSGNDAAYALAAAAGRAIKRDPTCSAWTAVNAFVAEMNRQAETLGMSGSHFRNPDGIHQDDHYLSITDMAMLGKLSMENPIVMEFAGTPRQVTQIGDRSVTWKNTNYLIRDDLETLSEEDLIKIQEMDHWDALYCQYAVGLKTGRTTPAGSCLLSAFEVRDQKLVIGVFGCQDGEYRFTDTLHLLNQALEIE